MESEHRNFTVIEQRFPVPDRFMGGMTPNQYKIEADSHSAAEGLLGKMFAGEKVYINGAPTILHSYEGRRFWATELKSVKQSDNADS